MNIRRFAWAAVWAGSMALVATIALAQRAPWTPVGEPVIKAGDDLGFRVEWLNGRTPYGHIVIRQDGRWIEAHIGAPADRQVVPPPPAPPPIPGPRR